MDCVNNDNEDILLHQLQMFIEHSDEVSRVHSLDCEVTDTLNLPKYDTIAISKHLGRLWADRTKLGK